MNHHHLNNLARRTQLGEVAAFTQIVNTVRDRLVARADRILENFHDAEDAVQNASYKLFRNINRWDEEKGHFYNYFVQYVIREAQYIQRTRTTLKGRTFRGSQLTADIPVVDFSGIEDDLCKAETLQKIEAYLEKMPLPL